MYSWFAARGMISLKMVPETRCAPKPYVRSGSARSASEDACRFTLGFAIALIGN
jgi:hypothetical protein